MNEPTHTHRGCARSELLLEHRPLLTSLARRVARNIPASVELDDLIQAGLFGLDLALSNFSDERGATLGTYAHRRIHGAMLDELRNYDQLPRKARGKVRQVQAAVRRLETQLGRPPRTQEIAEALDWPLQEVHDTLVSAGAASVRAGESTDLSDVDEAANWDDAAADYEHVR